MSNIVSKIITDRSFHKIPDWMMQSIDVESFYEILKEGGAIIDDAILNASSGNPIGSKVADCIDFWIRLGKMNLFNIKELVAYSVKNGYWWATSDVMILGYLFQTNKNWRAFFKWRDKHSSDVMELSANNLMPACQIFYYQTNEIPVAIVDKLLEYMNKQATNYDKTEFQYLLTVVTTEIGLFSDFPYGEVFHVSYGSEFMDAFIDMLIKRSRRYYWGDYVFSIYHLWNNGVPYFPSKNMDYEHLLCYLQMMSNSLKIELSDRITDLILDVVNGDDDYRKNELFHHLEYMVADKANINNIRFLMLFSGVEFVREKLDMWVSNVISRITENSKQCIPLRDFRYLSPKKINNDNIQRAFLMQGGDPTTLLYDKDNYIYTSKGVLDAIKYCDTFYISQLLDDNRICEIISDEIVGHVPFSPYVEKILLVLNEKQDNEKMHVTWHMLKSVISKSYPVLESGSTLCEPLLRVSDIGMVEAQTIIWKHPDAAYQIPVHKQHIDVLLSIIYRNRQAGYKPLLFEHDDDGLEKYLSTNQIISLLSSNPSYFADIHDDRVANLIYKHNFLWMN